MISTRRWHTNASSRCCSYQRLMIMLTSAVHTSLSNRGFLYVNFVNIVKQFPKRYKMIILHHFPDNIRNRFNVIHVLTISFDDLPHCSVLSILNATTTRRIYVTVAIKRLSQLTQNMLWCVEYASSE